MRAIKAEAAKNIGGRPRIEDEREIDRQSALDWLMGEFVSDLVKYNDLADLLVCNVIVGDFVKLHLKPHYAQAAALEILLINDPTKYFSRL
ncbi:hypothetical protein [Nitrosomonas sp.]|uniref:hypothetical protein n=1 Tax=Nitrosomonas sp. TaxID=42353 RepID=UPI0037C63267